MSTKSYYGKYRRLEKRLIRIRTSFLDTIGEILKINNEKNKFFSQTNVEYFKRFSKIIYFIITDIEKLTGSMIVCTKQVSLFIERFFLNLYVY